MIDYEQLRSLTTEAAVRDLIKREFEGEIGVFVDAIDSELNRLLRSELKQAQLYVEVSQRMAEFLPAEWYPRFLSQQARLALWKGHFESANSKYSEALRLFLIHRNFEAAARLRKGQVEVLMYLGDYRGAVATGKKALSYFRRKGLKTDEAQLLTNIGNVYHRSDRNKLALQYYTKARKIFASRGGVPLAIVDFNRANIFANLNELGRARRLYLDAASIYERAGLDLANAQARYSVAYLSFLESKYAEALEGFEKVYDSFIRLGDKRMAAITLLDLTELEVHLHLFTSAIFLGKQVIGDLNELRLSYEEGKASYFVATAMVEIGDLAEARLYLKRAASIFRRENNELWLGMVKLVHAKLALAAGRVSQALKFTGRAEVHFRDSGDKRRENDALLLQMEALARLKDSARDFESRINDLRRAGLVKYQQYKLANIAGEFFLKHGRNRDAVREFRIALEVAEDMLHGLNQDEIRALFAADVTDSYNMLAQAYLAEQKQQSALIEVLRGMAVLNLQSRNRRLDRIPTNLKVQIDSLRSQIARLQRAEESGRREATSAVGYRDLEQRLWRLQRAAKKDTSGGREREIVTTEQVEKILERLGNRTLVHLHQYRNGIGAFIARAGEVRHVGLSASHREFQRVLRKTYFLLEQGLAQRSDDNIYSRALDHYRRLLCEYLIDPISQHFGDADVVLAVDREFLQVPFSILLTDDQTPLLEKYNLSVIVNPLDLARREHRWNSKKRSSIIGSESESLPLVREECEAIQEIYGEAQLLAGESAGTEAVREALRVSGGFVHIAAHASRAAENPLFSRILLANGPLFPFEISGQIKAQLVTLSGCQTAAPGLYYGNSFSLAKAFYQAGSRAVLASLWSVADDVTKEFMTEFYKHLTASKSVKNSYIQAVTKVRDLTDNPAHWGAFVLLGVIK